ncbi:MAG: type II secretion system protein GspD [Candidatus Zhuqueibacterota bacterium]
MKIPFRYLLITSSFFSIVTFFSCSPNINNLKKQTDSYPNEVKRNLLFQNSIRNIENLTEDGLFSQSLSQIQHLLSINPNFRYNPTLYILAAKSLIGMGKNEDARVALELAEASSSLTDSEASSFQKRVEDFLNQPSLQIQKPTFQDSTNTEKITKDVSPDHSDIFITNTWFETDIRQVLLDISQATGIPIVWDNTVQGIVTHEVNEVPFLKVLEDILFSNGFVHILKKGTYYVGSIDLDSPSFNTLSETSILQLSNIMAQDAIQLLPESFRIFVRATNSSNTVCITAPPSYAKRIKQDLKSIDTPVKQIEIEVVVVQFYTSDIQKLGIDWSLSSLGWNDKEASLVIIPTMKEDPLFALNYLRTALKIGDKAYDLATSLRALSDAGVVKIQATPRVRTMNGRTAIFQSLKEQYFMITAGETGNYFGYMNRLETIQSGIQLMITPYADSTGFITVSVKPQIDDVIGEGANGLPEISRRSANTTVRVGDGETITIGGLRMNKTQTYKSRVPVLGKIPVLGYLFGKTETEEVESELVIFITPHVL